MRILLEFSNWHNIPLFRNVKQINGDKVYRHLCTVGKVFEYSETQIDELLGDKFVYVLEGSV